MAWTVTLLVRDVNDAPIAGAELRRSTWTGKGSVQQEAPLTISDNFTFTADDAVINIICELRHPRFATLIMVLMRSPGETIWRWEDPARQVMTNSQSVTIEATLSRVGPIQTLTVPEEELQRLAAKKGELDQRLRRQNPKAEIPMFAPVSKMPGVLVMKNGIIRFGLPAAVPNLHLLNPELLGSKAGHGWDGFSSSVHRVDLVRDSETYLVEYGEVGVSGPRGPRFLVGMWVPRAAVKPGVKQIDFLVWFTPNTQAKYYPPDRYPFRDDYPNTLSAVGKQTPYTAAQMYVNLAFNHLYTQHYLAYQMSAAGRATVIVIPIAPSSHFELWESRPTLMRMLKELCLWMPRLQEGRQAKVYPARPGLGRVGVASFSSGVRRLGTLIDTGLPTDHYQEDIWGSARDTSDFHKVWRELWAIDGNLDGLKNWNAFASKLATWVRQAPDRRLRIYKNDYTDGRWDPREAPASGEFAKMIRGGKPLIHDEGKLWALSMGDPGGRWHVASFSREYLLGVPGSTTLPIIETGDVGKAHENMPRAMFGHAAVTSGFARSG